MPEPSLDQRSDFLLLPNFDLPNSQETLTGSVLSHIDWAQNYIKKIKSTPRILFGGNKNKALATGLSLLGLFGLACQIGHVTGSEFYNITNPTPQVREQTPRPKNLKIARPAQQSPESTPTATPTYANPELLISGTATAAHKLGLPDTMIDKPENLLNREKINRIKRGLVLINGQIDNKPAGGSGGLYDVNETGVYFISNAHVLQLDLPIIQKIDPKYKGVKNPQIQTLQFFRPGIDSDPETYPGSQIDYEVVPDKDLVVIWVGTHSTAYSKEDRLNYEKTDTAPSIAVVMGFPDQVRADTFEAIAYINEGDFHGPYNPGTEAGIFKYKIPLWHGNSGGILVAEDNSPFGYRVVGVPTFFGYERKNNVSFTGSMGTAGIEEAFQRLKNRHQNAQTSR